MMPAVTSPIELSSAGPVRQPNGSVPAGSRMTVNPIVYAELGVPVAPFAEKAVAVNPNDADSYAMLGRILNWTGSPERGEEEIEKALRRNPRPPFWYIFGLGHARFLQQDYQGAITAFRRGIQTHPSWLPNRYYLAASYAHAGDSAKAEFELGQGAVRTVIPSVIAGDLTPYRNISDLNHFMEAMGKAGVR